MVDYHGPVKDPFLSWFGSDGWKRIAQQPSTSPGTDVTPKVVEIQLSDSKSSDTDVTSKVVEKQLSDSRRSESIKVRKINTFYSNLILFCKEVKVPGQMWFDTGCRRCVSGPDDHDLFQKKLLKIGIVPLKINKQEEFIFGDAKTAVSDCAFVYPTFLNGKFASVIDMARVPVPCPALFSLQMAKQWHCITDHCLEEVVVQKHGRRFPFHKGTPYLNVLDYTLENLDLTGVPKEFFA